MTIYKQQFILLITEEYVIKRRKNLKHKNIKIRIQQYIAIKFHIFICIFTITKKSSMPKSLETTTQI